MTGFFARLFGGGEPALGEASVRDAAVIAALHAQSFQRGWSDGEVEGLLRDRAVLAHRAMSGRRFDGFIISRLAAGEAEILSVAVAHRRQGRGLAARLLDLHMQRLAGLGVEAIFLEVDESNMPAIRLYTKAGFHEVARRENYYSAADGKRGAALVLRRDLV